MSSNPSARIEKLGWPVMIVKLRKGQKFYKQFQNLSKSCKKICDIYIFRTISLSNDYPVSLFQALNSFTSSYRSIKLNKIIFREIEKKISSKNCKSWNH